MTEFERWYKNQEWVQQARANMAAQYRELRKTSPQMARLAFRRERQAHRLLSGKGSPASPGASHTRYSQVSAAVLPCGSVECVVDPSAVLALHLVRFTGPDNQVVEINPELVIALREPRGEKGKHFHHSVNCLIYTADGAFTAVVENCAEASKRLERAKEQGNKEE